MKKTFAPTLMLRVFFTMLIANTLLWIVLLAQIIFSDAAVDTKTRAEGVLKASHILDRCTSSQEAISFVTALSTTYEWFAGTPNLVELWSHDNKRLFFDSKRLHVAYSPLIGDPQKMTQVVVFGRNYNVFRHDGPRWSLRIAIPHLPNSAYEYIKSDALDPDFLACFSISLTILLLPLWFAITRGLLPLRDLSNRLANREAEDLGPLDFDVKYRELQPVVTALDSLLLRLCGKVQREQRFIQDAAHALRTPMAQISAQVQVLAKAATRADKDDAERNIDHAISRASHLTQQLLELARVDGLRAQDNQMQDIVQLVRLDLAQIIPAAMARDIEVSLEAPETLLYCLERNTFQSILYNLLDNAIRYGHVGGVVEILLKAKGGNLLLTVADDGPGIDSAEQEWVFDRFYRRAAHEESGTGLGLAIVRQAAARLGGTVALSAGIGGKGCRFSVQISAGKTVTLQTDFSNMSNSTGSDHR